ncbi:hypothetical protein ACWEN6_07495 [Sphaerisporangium sp. NPDC004334]
MGLRGRSLYLLIAAVLSGAVVAGALIFAELKPVYDIVREEPDPRCVAQSAADNRRLAQALAPHLPSVTAEDFGFEDGCGPPESGGPWVRVDLASSSLEEALRGFRKPLWTPIPEEEAQREAGPGRRGLAVTGEVDHRRVELYAFRSTYYHGMVRAPVMIRAWFRVS